MKTTIPTEFALLVLALAQARSAQTQTLVGPNDCISAGVYTLCSNLWGADSGVGSQTTTLQGASGNSVAWETNYTWSNGPNNVKSYPNVGHNTAKGMQLQDIVSAPTSWQWNYKSASADLRADVSYDIWTGVPQSGDVASSASSYEIMIWLSNRGPVGGIGSTVAQGLQLGGHTFDLKHGPNSNWDVFSFITAEGDITDFQADLNDFFQYLINEQGVAKTQYLQAIQSGTEPFTGSADLVITNFSVGVTTKEASSSSTSTSATSSSSVSPAGSSSSAQSASGTWTSTLASTSASASSNSPAPSSSPPSQGSDPIPVVGVRAASATQCRLQIPAGQTESKVKRRGWASSWLR